MVETNKFATAYQPEIIIESSNVAPRYGSYGVSAANPPAYESSPPGSPAYTPDNDFLGYTTASNIPPEEIKRLKLKKRRKRNTVISGVVGGTVGLVVLGPIGAVGMGVGSALITKHASKAREKRVLRKMESRLAQEHGIVGNAVPVYTGCVA